MGKMISRLGQILSFSWNRENVSKFYLKSIIPVLNFLFFLNTMHNLYTSKFFKGLTDPIYIFCNAERVEIFRKGQGVSFSKLICLFMKIVSDRSDEF